MNTQLKCNGYITHFGLSAACFSVLLLFSFFSFSQIKISARNVWVAPGTKAKQKVMKNSDYKSLKEAAWQYRILIVEKTEAAEIESFKDTLSQNAKAIEERRLLVITIFDQNVLAYTGQIFEPSHIQAKELTNKLRGKKALLIGLDGGNKAVYDQLDLKTVFAQIDGMPMRRRELRDQ